MSKDIHRVGDLLGGLLHRLGIDREVAAQEALVRWDEVVGERIAAVAWATAMNRGTLFVEVASSAWMSELNMMRHELMARMNAGGGEGKVEKIVFLLAERPRAPDAGHGGEGER